MGSSLTKDLLYRNNLKDREFDKEALQNFDAEQATSADRQGASEHQNSEVKPTQPKTDSSNCFGIVPEMKLISPKASMDDVDVLLVFGSSDGAMYRSLSSWLKKGDNRFLIFIEEREELFLKAKEAAFAKDPKVRLFYYKRGDEEIFQQIAWEFVFLRFAYAEVSAPLRGEAEEFFLQMEHYHRGVDLLASDSEDMGLKVLSNAMKNLFVLPQSKLGGSLEGKCRGMTAVICGAGPSLREAMPLLESLKEKAILFAGGSAVCALNANGINPHIYANIDPEPPYKRFFVQDSFEIPFFYQGRFSSDLLQTVHSPLLWMPDSGSYPLETWLAAECGVFAERFDAGWTVANFCTSLAAYLGYSTIIFVGMDFSCGPDAIYASKIPGDENRDGLIELEKNKLYSKRDWLMAAEWMSVFAKKNPAIQWINATAGGIDLPGIERKTLFEVAESLDHASDIAALVYSLEALAAPSNVTLEKVRDVRKKVVTSFEKTLSLCEALLKMWEKSFPNSPLELGEYAALEHDLEQEICASHFLIPQWSVWKRPILRSSFHELGQHIHRLLFFKQAIEMHLPYLRSFL